ncbi:MAG: hypothetical protein DWQ31_04600 [Planctomycetota bacterium]|nr:MAG: hypothetical protein DWQ31_04600 [Planctomycetota bacterium]REJ97126.1 MAG: hypothetical protein DWQ35_02605 [Planctomycetota bacterium]REK27935.1 MAG: hypothetical protein DWQ42_05885 [Planctomycetota bacterium]REK42261.1 MAG: hypothetical protein DWQ46_14080 [Planctomycetota bacterium]
MNIVGKIFVFLIFVMSLVFATFSVIVYATHTNYRDEILREEAVGNKPLGWKAQLEDLQRLYEELQAQLEDREDKISQILAERRQAVAGLEAEKERLLAQQTEAQKNYQDLRQLHEKKLAEVESTMNDIRRTQGEIDDLRQQIKRQQETIDETFAAMILRTETNNQLQGEVKRLETTNETLTDQVARAKQLVSFLSDGEVTLDTPVDAIDEPPAVEGRILAVRKRDKDTFVELSVGSDDGLLSGHELQVFRGARYLGNVIVLQTNPDRAAAIVDRATRKGPVQDGDRFESRRATQRRI